MGKRLLKYLAEENAIFCTHTTQCRTPRRRLPVPLGGNTCLESVPTVQSSVLPTSDQPPGKILIWFTAHDHPSRFLPIRLQKLKLYNCGYCCLHLWSMITGTFLCLEPDEVNRHRLSPSFRHGCFLRLGWLMMVSPQHQLLNTQLLLVFLLLPLPLHASLRDSHSSVRHSHATVQDSHGSLSAYHASVRDSHSSVMDSRASLRDSRASVGDSDVSVRGRVAKCLDQLFQADVAFWVNSQVKMF